MSDAPEKLWMTAEEQGWPGSFRSFRLSDLEHPEEYPAYVRADLYEQVKRERDEAMKALEPFAEIAGEPWADENGWTNAACQNDRICDWFGPSAFRTARRALGGRSDG